MNKRLSVMEHHNLMLALADQARTSPSTPTGRTPSPPEFQTLPAPAPKPDRLKVPEGATTLQDIANVLADPAAHGLTTVPGRTLPKNHQWFGHDIPGRGGAAARRLRQQAKLAAKDVKKGTDDPKPPAD